MKIAAYILAGLLAFAALTFGLNALGYASFAFWGPKYEEARRTIVQQSIRRQEGVSEGIAALCLNMKLETNPESRKAFANMILVQAGATGTELSKDAFACKQLAQTELGL